MQILFDSLFSSVAIGHTLIDILNGQRAVLMTYLSVQFGLSNTELGFYSTLFIMSGALAQPIFGFLTDKVGPRWMAAGGLLWMSLFYGLALVTPGQQALWLLILASLGSAAFHPAGTMQATLRGRMHFSGRETTSTAYFFVFGQAGHFLGPFLAGPLLQRFGLLGLLVLVAPVALAGLNTAYQLRPLAILNPSVQSVAVAVPLAVGPGPFSRLSTYKITQATIPNSSRRKIFSSRLKRNLIPLIAFGLLAAFQAWTQQNVITFMPKHLSDLGHTPGEYGIIVALFMGGSALGNAFGGPLADRFGKRHVAVTALGLASIPLFGLGLVGWSPWLFLLMPLSGALTGSVHSILVVLAQRMIPSGMALASGLILGFMFSAGAVGAFLSGLIADSVGLEPIFLLSAAIAFTGAGLALTIRKEEPSSMIPEN